MSVDIKRDKPVNIEYASTLELELEALRDSETEHIVLTPEKARDLLLSSLVNNYRSEHSNRHDIVETLYLISQRTGKDVDYTDIHLKVIEKLEKGEWPSYKLPDRREI